MNFPESEPNQSPRPHMKSQDSDYDALSSSLNLQSLSSKITKRIIRLNLWPNLLNTESYDKIALSIRCYYRVSCVRSVLEQKKKKEITRSLIYRITQNQCFCWFNLQLNHSNQTFGATDLSLIAVDFSISLSYSKAMISFADYLTPMS